MPETEAGDRIDPLEMIRCAQSNVRALKGPMIDASRELFFRLVEEQLRCAAEAIEKDRLVIYQFLKDIMSGESSSTANRMATLRSST